MVLILRLVTLRLSESKLFDKSEVSSHKSEVMAQTRHVSWTTAEPAETLRRLEASSVAHQIFVQTFGLTHQSFFDAKTSEKRSSPGAEHHLNHHGDAFADELEFVLRLSPGRRLSE